jgi:uncharacterized phage infection (PIP) family protein YhgE
MTDQIASITLRADVSDLKTASNELDKLGQAAAGAVDKADDLNSVFRAGAESAKQGSEGIKEQQNALKGLLENIDPVNKALTAWMSSRNRCEIPGQRFPGYRYLSGLQQNPG